MRRPEPPETEPRDDLQTEELFLVRLRYREGRLAPVESNRPLLLDDPRYAWVVFSGSVDLFAAPVRDGEVIGRRRHLSQIGPGQALFGVGTLGGAEGPAVGLVAVGLAGTQVIRVDRGRLGELGRDPEFRAEVLRLLEGWVTALTEGLHPALPPKECRQVESGEEVALEAEGSARPRHGVVWIAPAGRALRWCGAAALPERSRFPLSSRAWIQAGEAASLRVEDTAAFDTADPAWSALEGFHRLSLATAAERLREAREAERARLRRTSEVETQLTTGAFRRLASVLHPEGAHPAAAGPDEDPLLAACRRVGKAQGIEIREAPSGGRVQEPLYAILRASHVRWRVVRLHEGWWREEHGPLLGFLGEDRRPVALLPSGAGYTIAGPAPGGAVPAGNKSTADLSPMAVSFYSGFPERLTGAWDVLGFGTRGCGRDVGLVCLEGVAAGLIALFPSLAMGYLVDTALPGGQRGALLQLTLALVAAAAAAALFGVTSRAAFVRIQARLGGSVQAGLWDHLLSLPLSFFKRYTAGNLAQRAMGISSIRQIGTRSAALVVTGALTAGPCLALLLTFEARLAFTAIGLTLLWLLATGGLLYFVQLRLMRELNEQQARVPGLVLQLLTGVAKLRAAGAEARAFDRWTLEFARQQRIAYRSRTLAAGQAALNAGWLVLPVAAVFALVAGHASEGVRAGGFLTFYMALTQLLGSAAIMVMGVSSLLACVPLYEAVQPILDAAPEVTPERADPGTLSGALELSHVHYRYSADGPLILNDLSLKIEPGEFVAIVGPSGAGKSTLLRLLLGFDAPETGSVYYDGQDLTKLDVAAVRRQIGVVMQNGALMPGSVQQNITGVSNLTLDDAWEAARLAGIENDIRQMPMGMHTAISEGMSTFSGGQRQRLMIARAVAGRPRILLFDEATSALDNPTQAMVTRSLELLQATRVVIAHRMSTIQNADRIFVLEGGLVVQSGTYGELVKQPGLFQRLARRQTA